MTGQVTDNIEELLCLIVRFAKARRRVLVGNVRHMHRAGFVPLDLAVHEFVGQLQDAIEEYRGHRRLMLRDHAHVRYGPSGRLHLLPQTDEHARGLLVSDPPGYVEYQAQRLWENTLNEKVAMAMLRRHTSGLPWGRVRESDGVDPLGWSRRRSRR